MSKGNKPVDPLYEEFKRRVTPEMIHDIQRRQRGEEQAIQIPLYKEDYAGYGAPELERKPERDEGPFTFKM